MPGTFSPPPQVSNPDMHHGTCVTPIAARGPLQLDIPTSLVNIFSIISDNAMWWGICWLTMSLIIFVDARYASETFIPSNVTISDCLVQEITGLSHVECGMRAWFEKIIALVYVGSTRTCHFCLPPKRAGDQPRKVLPEGHTVVTRGNYHD